MAICFPSIFPRRFESVPTERALKRLFGADAQYVFRYDTSSPSAAPVEVWVWRERPRVAHRRIERLGRLAR